MSSNIFVGPIYEFTIIHMSTQLQELLLLNVFSFCILWLVPSQFGVHVHDKSQ